MPIDESQNKHIHTHADTDTTMIDIYIVNDTCSRVYRKFEIWIFGSMRQHSIVSAYKLGDFGIPHAICDTSMTNAESFCTELRGILAVNRLVF